MATSDQETENDVRVWHPSNRWSSWGACCFRFDWGILFNADYLHSLAYFHSHFQMNRGKPSGCANACIAVVHAVVNTYMYVNTLTPRLKHTYTDTGSDTDLNLVPFSQCKLHRQKNKTRTQNTFVEIYNTHTHILVSTIHTLIHSYTHILVSSFIHTSVSIIDFLKRHHEPYVYLSVHIFYVEWFTYICTYNHIDIYMHIYICVNVSIYIYTYTYMYTDIYVDISIYILYVHVYTYSLSVCECVYMYVYVYVYTMHMRIPHKYTHTCTHV